MGQNGDKGKKMNDGCSSIVTTLFSRELSKGRRDMTRLPMTQDKEITEEEEEAALRALSLSLSLCASNCSPPHKCSLEEEEELLLQQSHCHQWDWMGEGTDTNNWKRDSPIHWGGESDKNNFVPVDGMGQYFANEASSTCFFFARKHFSKYFFLHFLYFFLCFGNCF